MTAVPDHALLVRVMRWALANDWRQQWRGWTSPDRTVAVHPHGMGLTGLVEIYCRDDARDPWDAYVGGPWRQLAVRSVTEAVDWLVLCDVLPVGFSSAYAAGHKAGEDEGHEDALDDFLAGWTDSVDDATVHRIHTRIEQELDAALSAEPYERRRQLGLITDITLDELERVR